MAGEYWTETIPQGCYELRISETNAGFASVGKACFDYIDRLTDRKFKSRSVVSKHYEFDIYAIPAEIKKDLQKMENFYHFLMMDLYSYNERLYHKDSHFSDFRNYIFQTELKSHLSTPWDTYRVINILSYYITKYTVSFIIRNISGKVICLQEDVALKSRTDRHNLFYEISYQLPALPEILTETGMYHPHIITLFEPELWRIN